MPDLWPKFSDRPHWRDLGLVFWLCVLGLVALIAAAAAYLTGE